jgi:membrane-associated phospholipid phosphatase
VRAYTMTPFEWLAVTYFIALLSAARPAPRPRRGALFVGGAIALVIVARFALPWTARAWLAHAYLVLGYWIPAAFVPASPNERFERWLAHTDRYLTRAWPLSGTDDVLELAYLLCYPLVPAAFVSVLTVGTMEDIERFWVSVLGAGYACYVTLPWTAARPPRLLNADPTRVPRALAAVNAMVLGRVGHQLVTFPSGHVAVSVAAAFAVGRVRPEMGAAFGVVALLIAIAAVAGRYHFVVDVLLGLLVGAVIPGLVLFI